MENKKNRFLNIVSITIIITLATLLVISLLPKSNNDFTQLYERTSSSIVTIESYGVAQQGGSGSGIVYDIKGDLVYILTNAHVVEGARNLKIYNSFLESSTEVEILGYDSYHDLAVLTVKNLDGVKKATIGNSDHNKIGESVYAIGSPLSKNYYGTITDGIISGPERFINPEANSYWGLHLIQTNAVINPGNSGGALFNSDGEVIGINTIKYVDNSLEGMGFAIPINDAMDRIEYYEEGKTTRVSVGIQIMENLVIAKTITGSPASEADIRSGDKIIGIDGHEISDLYEFNYYLYNYLPGDEVVLTIDREGKEIKTKLTLGYYEN